MWVPQPACSPGLDNSLGPWAGELCRGGFDFTLFFEEAILAVPLQSLLLLLLPTCALRLARSDVKVVPSTLRWLKASASISLAALNFALLILWITTPSTTITHTRATIPTAILSLIASIGLGLLSWLAHQRSVRPSFVLSVYLFLSILFDTARARTLWMLGPHQTIPAIFTCTLAVRAVMILLESTEKRRILVPEHKGYSKEVTSGTFNRSVFFWLTSLFINGYRNILQLDDLYPLDPKLASEPLYRKLAGAWDQVPDKTVPGALFSTWLRAFAGPLAAAIVPKLFQIAFNYAQPFLIDEAIRLASQPQQQPYNNHGFGLIGAYVIVYTGIAVSTGQYDWRNQRAASMTRGSTTALVYRKALRLDLTSPNVSPSAALTLVGTDSETISQGIMQLHEVWSGLVEIGIGIYLIYRQLGAACAMPVALVFVVLFATAFLAVPTGKASAEWIKASQDRVSTTSKTLGNIKWLKISGLNDVAFSVIQKLRTVELEVSKRFRVLLGISMMFLICTPIWSPILTFSTFVATAARTGDTLTIQKAFTAYSLLILVNQPLVGIVMGLPLLASAMASFQRIQDFLNGKERVDARLASEGVKIAGAGKSVTESPKAAGLGPDVELSDMHESELPVADLPLSVIASVKGTFSWSDDSKPVIDIDNWNVRRRAFTLVLGPVGCGKSTLLKCLLGELSSFKGTISINFSGVTYCGQTAWIPNDSVRNIITGHAAFDPAWYHKVIKACALEQDIASWPNGDSTVAGTKGISMSGGQKHRLAIARALYARQELLVLDDVFSGLDSSTEDIVFNNLFGNNGLLRHTDTTVILASSDSRRVPFADDVVLLNDEGRIIDNEAITKVTRQPSSSGKRAGTSDSESVKVSPITITNDKPPATILGLLDDQADSARQLGDWGMYSFYARAAGWFSLSTFAGAMIVFAFCDSFPGNLPQGSIDVEIIRLMNSWSDIWLKWWAESNEQRPNQDLGKWLGVYAALGVGSVASVLFGMWQLFIVIINKSGVYFHGVLLDTTSRAPMTFHSSVDSGITVNRFSQDLQLIDMELPAAALGLAVGVAFGVARFIVMSVSSRYMAAILPFLIPTFYAIQHFYLRTSRQMRLLDIEHKAPLYSQLIETLEGLATIRAFRWEDNFEKVNLRRLDDSQRPKYLLACLQSWLTFSVDMVIAVIAVVLIVLVTTLREQIGPGFIGVALTNVLAFSGCVKAIITSWVMLEVSLGAVARVRNFSLTTASEDDSRGQRAEPEGEWPSRGAVELRKVTASYASSGTVLKDVNISIEPGQKVAICGRTGSGKSSLILCLLRMMDLDSGTITIDNVDTATLPHEYVRSKIVAVPQESYIFDGTVRLNLDPGQTASDEDITAVLRRVQLWEKVKERGGLDAVIDDKFFSQGEAQLLVFARAMLRKGRVLVLDEITSSLDDESSKIIDEVLRSWFRDWTIIAIAHKLESILDFDRVAVVDSGAVVEYGEPRQLLGSESSFKALYERSSDVAH
ncbi:ABC transporter [Colletotrichum abscissum]|uniref:ABC transporter n=1 Tax=Colletotrichum abscissum TaxID=1671311 RepID=A0A9Q0AWV9_9PEZI|nr:ABC transporter [Colletotrichum abscissum]KAI3540901.1 ABC transporter [Colletotrichum abscissum]KAK1514811.1 ABC transporter [Colletotrichum abscissum]